MSKKYIPDAVPPRHRTRQQNIPSPKDTLNREPSLPLSPPAQTLATPQRLSLSVPLLVLDVSVSGITKGPPIFKGDSFLSVFI